MKEYIRSGGDITIIVASDKDVKVQPVREAFQKVLGRATIYGVPTKVINANSSCFKNFIWLRNS